MGALAIQILTQSDIVVKLLFLVIFTAKQSPKCQFSFRCSNGQCISSRKVCNFRADCRDKSDEVSCPTKCDFQKDFCKWTNAQAGDHYDWIRNKGPTPSKLTGPSADHTLNTSAGQVY